MAQPLRSYIGAKNAYTFVRKSPIWLAPRLGRSTHTTTRARVPTRAAWVDRGRACWMEWLDLVPLVAALATMALALTALTAGTELTRWLIDVALQTAVVLGFDAGTGRALTNYSEEL